MAEDARWLEDESLPVPRWYWRLSPDEREVLGWPRYLPDRRRPKRPKRPRPPRAPWRRRPRTFACRECGDIHTAADPCGEGLGWRAGTTT